MPLPILFFSLVKYQDTTEREIVNCPIATMNSDVQNQTNNIKINAYFVLSVYTNCLYEYEIPVEVVAETFTVVPDEAR